MKETYRIPIRLLKEAGFQAYYVGGCVRDRLMNRPFSDVDITTNALPDEIQRVFAAYHTLDIGIKHGTITVMIDSEPIEITTYRFDSGYTDHRHPTKVRFGVSLQEDLKRRDFTVNAIAWDGENPPVDPFGGRIDMENKIIRAVGNAKERFEEDALRILRALRFAAALDFTIEAETAAAMRERKHLLSYVSAERVFTEIKKLLVGKGAGRVIAMYTDILGTVIPELLPMQGFDQKNPHHIYDVLTHTLHALDAAEPDLTLRLAVLFHDCGKPETFTLDEKGIGHFYGHARHSMALAEARLDALKADNLTKKRVVRLIEHHDSPAEETLSQVVRRMRKMERDYPLLVALRRADNRGQAPIYYRDDLHDRCMALYHEAQNANAEAIGSKLSLNGRDLMANGAKEGKNIGFLLSALSEDVLEKRVKNEKDALLRFAKERYSDCFYEKNV
ncbi:MAG: CCA tRNA nucleotidyltransferase [Ruminococcaceae bacterium]|nr:CCA tRNA nucleotidyltransferase [Oscillospiraceae bacterium]